jgi:hypothetical protein
VKPGWRITKFAVGRAGITTSLSPCWLCGSACWKSGGWGKNSRDNRPTGSSHLLRLAPQACHCRANCNCGFSQPPGHRSSTHLRTQQDDWSVTTPTRRSRYGIVSYSRDSHTGHHNPWFAGRSRVVDGPAGGQVFQLDKGNLLSVGIREDLLVHAIEQSFQGIATFRFRAGTVRKTVQCRVPVGRFESDFSIGENRGLGQTRSGGYVDFELEGNLHYSSGGMVFGVLPLPGGATASEAR